MFLRLQVRVRLDGVLERKYLVHNRVDLPCDEQLVHVLESRAPTGEQHVHQPSARNDHSLLDRTDEKSAESDGFMDRGTDRYTVLTLRRRNTIEHL